MATAMMRSVRLAATLAGSAVLAGGLWFIGLMLWATGSEGALSNEVKVLVFAITAAGFWLVIAGIEVVRHGFAERSRLLYAAAVGVWLLAYELALAVAGAQ